MKRRLWLKNDAAPLTAPSAHFAVEESPVQLVASGLAANESIPLEVRADATTTLQDGVDFYWTPLYRNGLPVELRGDNNQVLILIPGVYRIVPGTYAAPVAVSLWEDETPFGELRRYADVSSGGIVSSSSSPSPVTCPTPPVADKEYMAFSRCDTTTSATVTLVFAATKANNAVCPPVAAGDPALVGYIDGAGVFAAGAYPGTLGPCSSDCPPAVAQGVLTTWGV